MSTVRSQFDNMTASVLWSTESVMSDEKTPESDTKSEIIDIVGELL